MINIKRAVQGKVHFQFYRDGYFYYQTDAGEEFGVPLEEVGSATLNATERGMLFMRWMRKWNESEKEWKADAANEELDEALDEELEDEERADN